MAPPSPRPLPQVQPQQRRVPSVPWESPGRESAGRLRALGEPPLRKGRDGGKDKSPPCVQEGDAGTGSRWAWSPDAGLVRRGRRFHEAGWEPGSPAPAPAERGSGSRHAGRPFSRVHKFSQQPSFRKCGGEIRLPADGAARWRRGASLGACYREAPGPPSIPSPGPAPKSLAGGATRVSDLIPIRFPTKCKIRDNHYSSVTGGHLVKWRYFKGGVSQPELQRSWELGRPSRESEARPWRSCPDRPRSREIHAPRSASSPSGTLGALRPLALSPGPVSAGRLSACH